MKAYQIVDAIKEYSKVSVQLERTCDVFISGTPESEVTGVVTTFMATVWVIRSAIALGCNMIITHEPTYFTGWDTTDWLSGDPVYIGKKKLIEENNIVIWRYHDLMHMKKPDGIYEGLLKELDWEQYRRMDVHDDLPSAPADRFEAAFKDYYDIPVTTIRELAAYFKTKLRMDKVRIIGEPEMQVERVGILVGGGSLGLGTEEMPMKVMREKNIDVMVCGEITEWTLPAYVNDARMLGMNKALLIVGHERTEEWGMKHMAEWLQPLIGLPVAFVDAKEPFKYL